MLLAAVMLSCPPPGPSAEMITLYLPFTNIPVLEFPVAASAALIIIFILFIACYLFATIAAILSQRILIDVIPSRIRNSIYSLRPTLVMIVSFPLVVIFGNLVPSLGFPISFILLSIISLAGILLIRNSFDHYIEPDEGTTIVDSTTKISISETNIDTQKDDA
jgi:hypothetical protein